jgi:arylsulfatase A-like enzyme
MAAIAGSVVLAGSLLLALGTGTDTRPNIVLVVWDTTRADRLSAYGYGRPTTPWLEDFASDGTLFRNAFTPSPWTPPAHASLFTGLHPKNHGLLQGKGDRVARGIPLLAETLRDAGYETVGFTSNAFISSVTGLGSGMERLVPLHDEVRGIGTVERTLEAVRTWLVERRNAPAGARRPLFLFVNLMDAHLPWRPEREDLAAVLGEAAHSPAVSRALQLGQKQALAHLLGIEPLDPEALEGAGMVYDAALRKLDRGTSRLMGLLREDRLLEGAFTAIVADHGEHLGEHGRMSHQLSLYDEVLRIPLVIRWPGHFEGGRQEAAQVRLQDLHPTILEAAGIAPPAGTARDARTLTESPLRARALLAAFYRPVVYLADARASFAGAPEEAFLPFQMTILGHQDPVGTPGARKLLHYVRSRGGETAVLEEESLFDLASDPGETRNLLQDGPAEERAAAERLAAGF